MTEEEKEDERRRLVTLKISYEAKEWRWGTKKRRNCPEGKAQSKRAQLSGIMRQTVPDVGHEQDMTGSYMSCQVRSGEQQPPRRFQTRDLCSVQVKLRGSETEAGEGFHFTKIWCLVLRNCMRTAFCLEADVSPQMKWSDYCPPPFILFLLCHSNSFCHV